MRHLLTTAGLLVAAGLRPSTRLYAKRIFRGPETPTRETREANAALAEAGDLVHARDAGDTDPTEWIELGRVAAGDADGRRDADEVTLFKSVGQAVQDVTAAGRAVAEARRRGLGRTIQL